ncbi:hypothetical protein TELCIR_03996 [Teladorsagia circumcincta]|uniref:Uncharacterized protein n=1 Tax=Teladorsagia circumcincta TaxID=45464 RepID=A0A2G9UWY9_TELCI|nr:hypothetical protein TELCIR_03996 [Teladorsagia circumcincta]
MVYEWPSLGSIVIACPSPASSSSTTSALPRSFVISTCPTIAILCTTAATTAAVPTISQLCSELPSSSGSCLCATSAIPSTTTPTVHAASGFVKSLCYTSSSSVLSIGFRPVHSVLGCKSTTHTFDATHSFTAQRIQPSVRSGPATKLCSYSSPCFLSPNGSSASGTAID